MHIYLSIDDTDNLDSPGSGHLSQEIAEKLQDLGLASQCTGITRHQLFVHESIPYTSHNSSMCFSAETAENKLTEIIRFAGRFLKTAAAPGSDPGLCVAVENDTLDRRTLIDFGRKAKQAVCTKEEAYTLAEEAGVHLSEHGGTGQGVVGALAGIGLRLSGSDGRFRGWLNLGSKGQTATCESLCSHPFVDAVVDEEGRVVPEGSRIILADDTVKTVFLGHRQVIPVTRTGGVEGAAWTTLTRPAVKRF